jgi:hypothetical protein
MQFGKIHGIALAILGIVLLGIQTVYYMMPTNVISGPTGATARYPSSLISHNHCGPSGNFATGRQSIGSTKAAFVLSNERSGSAGMGANHNRVQRYPPTSSPASYFSPTAFSPP